EPWEDWLQTHRVELNAMTTPQFIEWLDGKLADYAKLIPPPDVLETELIRSVEDKIREAITARILREATVDAHVEGALPALTKPTAHAAVAEGLAQMVEAMPDAEWRDHLEAVATALAEEDDAIRRV